MNPRNRRYSTRSGFTLVELMVVISIIALLATVVGMNVMKPYDDGAVATARAQIKNLKTAVISYKLQFRKLPSALEDLASLLDPPAIPVDPWGNDYVYSGTGSDFEIVSYGADGKAGGTGYDADISSKDVVGQERASAEPPRTGVKES